MKPVNKLYLTYLLLLIALFFRFLTFDVLPQNHLVNLIPLNNKNVTLVGTIVKPPENFNRKTRLYLESELLSSNEQTFKVSGVVRITIYKKKLSYQYGDRISIHGIRLRLPRNFKNEGAFDYEQYLKNQGIYVTGSVSKTKKIDLIDQDNGFWLLKKIYQLKDKMLQSLEISMSKENSTIIKSMVLGDRGSLSKTVKELFIRTGTAHLMAVSGLHIGFVAFVSFWTIRKIISYFMVRFFIEKALSGWIIPVSALLSVSPVLSYMLLVGWKTSSVRAGTMVIVYLLAIILSRQKEVYRSLIIAAFIILFWKPLSFQDIGFQLSFMAVLTIVFCYKELGNVKKTQKDIPIQESKIVKIIRNNITISLFATLGTAPLLFYHFNRITPYVLFANIITIPLAALIIPGAIICMLIFPISNWIGILGLKIISLLTYMLMVITEYFSGLPMASLRFATPPLWAVVSFYLFGFLWIKLRSGNRQWMLMPIGGILVISLSLNYPLFLNSNDIKVTFLDVGQGDSTLIQLPGGKTMLIDGGGLWGDFDIGESVVAPYLWDHGIEKIDYLVPTHSDNDHLEGLLYVIKEMKAGVLHTNSLIPFKTNLVQLENLAQAKNIPITDENVLFDNFNIRIEKFHPTKEYVLSHFDRKENNFSTVLKLTYGLVSFLFTSDIEKEAEEYLVKRYGDKLRSTILKVPHHGSRTSSTNHFLNAISPEVAVISVGALNRYRHPAKRVIERYKKNNIKILRTDLNGAITITTDGLKYKVGIFVK